MMTATQYLACDPSAPRHARQWTSNVLLATLPTDSADDHLVDDAMLCISELVTNAVQAGCHTIVVDCVVESDVVRLSLTDDAPGTPIRRNPTPLSARGRGLQLIAQLSRRWGVQAAGHGKQVWIELTRTAHNSA
jgi:anti-sigma regulatory factor (Ser/Thr protein kinase)